MFEQSNLFYVQINTPVTTPLLITKPPPPPNVACTWLKVPGITIQHCIFLGGEGWGRGKWISLTQAKDIKLKSQGVEKVNFAADCYSSFIDKKNSLSSWQLVDWGLSLDWNGLMSFLHHWLRFSPSFFHHHRVPASDHKYLQSKDLMQNCLFTKEHHYTRYYVE